MLLRVTALLGQEGASLPFAASLDWSDVEVNRQYPAQGSVDFTGTVRNVAGMLVLTGALTARMGWICDRCASAFDRDYTLDVEQMLAEELTDEENDEIYLLRDESADLYEVGLTALLLDLDMKVLCSEDCKGLCPTCGKDLNRGACACPGPADPRWDALRQLISDK